MKPKNCSPRLTALLEVPSKGTHHVHVTVRLSEPPTTTLWYQLKEAGLNITTSSGEILVGIIEVGKLSQLLSMSDVRWVESGREMAFEDK